ncbi:DUF2231 domain-containing protein [Deinococcus malanensis]|uniref:DUF2231 domain-containing protein n=1 Tax=Deinococcus malanensis TaxID=1706855 RepID=UPI00363C8B48
MCRWGLDRCRIPGLGTGPHRTARPRRRSGPAAGNSGALPTIIAGWADWTLTRGQARRTGLVHGLINETAFVLCAGSLLARQRGYRRLGRALSGGGLILASFGGVLGGQLVYRHGVGQERG